MIYFIQIGVDGPIKIGYSRHAATRVRTVLSSVNGSRLIGIAVGTRLRERRLHAMFRTDRLGEVAGPGNTTEWFRPSPRVLTMIAATSMGRSSLDWILNPSIDDPTPPALALDREEWIAIAECYSDAPRSLSEYIAQRSGT